MGRDWAGDETPGATVHVSVSGEVHAPGRYAIAESGSIGSLLAQAGGITDMAADAVNIERVDDTGQAQHYSVSLHDAIRLSETNLLREGDKLLVPHALEYSIVGEVQKPGSYRLDLSLTVAQAVAKAKGGTIFANLQHFEIRRKSADRTIVIAANPTDFVEPGDVIRVKVSAF
jgi:polysaccharide biosynthesis/export protein